MWCGPSAKFDFQRKTLYKEVCELNTSALLFLIYHGQPELSTADEEILHSV